MAGERFFQGLYYDNLGISYSSPTFTIHGANGRTLSSSNPAVIVLPSKASPGQFTRYNITANQSFDDDSGTSDIINNLFGCTSGRAITDDMPFFIYAVVNDNENAIAFMISRIPGKSLSPPAASIGVPGTPGANLSRAFFAFNSITTTSYDQNPCFCIGSFRMQMSASNDWTVQALATGNVNGNSGDGIGAYQNGIEFTVPLGHFGASTGSWTKPNGGTPPVFSSLTRYVYFFPIPNSPFMQGSFDMSDDGGTDGSGAVQAAVSFPFVAKPQSDRSGAALITTPSGTTTGTLSAKSDPGCIFTDNTNTVFQWSDFTNGDRRLLGSYFFSIDCNNTNN
jgi:hypothetical protein